MTPILVREFFAGYGLLTEALVAGLREASGREVRVDAVAELEPQFLQEWSKRHPEASTFCGSVGRFHPAELSSPGQGTTVFVAGIPCTGASKAGIAKNQIAHPEEHKDVGHLFLPVAHYIRRHRPDVVAFENVPNYAHTLSARVLRQTLDNCGYHVFERKVDAFEEFTTPSRRVRWVLVATRRPFNWLYAAERFDGTLASCLDTPSPRDEAEAFSAERVQAHAAYIARKRAEGCNFKTRIIDGESRQAPTICKTYGKIQPSATFVRTAQSYRMLRPREVARLMGFPDSFPLPANNNVAYQVLGQGVCYLPFLSLGRALGDFLREGRGSETRAA